jgi:hypothetical protein
MNTVQVVLAQLALAAGRRESSIPSSSRTDSPTVTDVSWLE